MKRQITYAKVGGPPDDWSGLLIFNLDTGEQIMQVTECDTEEGYVIVPVLDDKGKLTVQNGVVLEKRVTGRFEICEPWQRRFPAMDRRNPDA